MTLIDAVYVNHSGAKRLLEYFISHVFRKKEIDQYYFILDSRLSSEWIQYIPANKLKVIHAKEQVRKKIYANLPENTKAIFCFANVPPPVKIKNIRVSILQHNPFFFENPGYSFLTKIIYAIKKTYIKIKCDPDYHWIVQTERIKQILVCSLGIADRQIHIHPFFKSGNIANGKRSADDFSFIYPADGVPQKNHLYLLNVWEEVFKKYGLLPQLHLTIPVDNRNLIHRVDRLKTRGLQITNHGFISVNELNELYAQCNYLVFPSLSESFGLPLVEAAQCGLKVIGSDLPYIYQVVRPSAVFDPHSVDSLCDIILSIKNGLQLKPTEIMVKDNIEELVKFINLKKDSNETT